VEHFVSLFREIQPKFSRLYSRILTRADLTLPQYALLLELIQSLPNPVPMTYVSKKLYVTKPAVTSLVDRLEKNRFLKRLDNPEDRRVFLLEIQPKGRRVVRKTQGHLLKLLLSTVARLSPKEKNTVRKFYEALSKNLDEALRQHIRKP